MIIEVKELNVIKAKGGEKKTVYFFYKLKKNFKIITLQG